MQELKDDQFKQCQESAKKWGFQTVRIVATGPHADVYVDGKKLGNVNDYTIKHRPHKLPEVQLGLVLMPGEFTLDTVQVLGRPPKRWWVLPFKYFFKSILWKVTWIRWRIESIRELCQERSCKADSRRHKDKHSD